MSVASAAKWRSREDALDHLVDISGGDARSALNVLERGRHGRR